MVTVIIPLDFSWLRVLVDFQDDFWEEGWMYNSTAAWPAKDVLLSQWPWSINILELHYIGHVCELGKTPLSHDLRSTLELEAPWVFLDILNMNTFAGWICFSFFFDGERYVDRSFWHVSHSRWLLPKRQTQIASYVLKENKTKKHATSTYVNKMRLCFSHFVQLPEKCWT